MVVLPAPDGPTRAVNVPGAAMNERFLRTSPLSTLSGRAADSSEARDISFARGYEKCTSLNSTFGCVAR